MMMTKLPSKDESILSIQAWASTHCIKITVETVVHTEDPRADILLELLERVRFVVRRSKFIHSAANDLVSKEMHEDSLRAEVRNWPAKFCFNVGEMRKYHPIHLGEMIIILLDLLKQQGIDARTPNPMMALFN